MPLSKMNLIIAFFIIITILASLLFWDIKRISVDVDPSLAVDFPQSGFSHDGISTLLHEFVDAEGQVNYKAWSEDKDALYRLDKYLAAVALFSPENAPHRFNKKNDALIYWVYAYKAQVIKSILIHWPIKSVTDIKAPVELLKGLGFFYKQNFTFGEQEYNLYHVENKKILSGKTDPRVHFILNCGSGGCPVIRPVLPSGGALDPFLSNAAIEFISDPKHFYIDDESKTIFASHIFERYQEDFLKALNPSPKQVTLFDYFLTICDQILCQKIIERKGYTLEFIEYDWSINKSN